MRNRFLILLFIWALLSMGLFSFSQENGSLADRVLDFPAKLLTGIQKKSKDFELRIERQSENYLQRMAGKEEKLFRKMYKLDSVQANNLFGQSRQDYAQFIRRIKAKADAIPGNMSGEYLPWLDSMQGSLSFLKQSASLVNQSTAFTQKISSSLEQVRQLQGKLQQTEAIKQFIRERKEQIHQALGRYTNLPHNISKEWESLNKEVYYYTQQIREYREALNDPNKMEQKALALLNRFPAFRKFMKDNSILGGLFNVPDNYGTAQALAGLQTRDQIQQLIRSRFGSGIIVSRHFSRAYKWHNLSWVN